MPGKGKNETPHLCHFRDEQMRHKNAQMERSAIVREENIEVQHRTDPKSRSGDWSGRLRG